MYEKHPFISLMRERPKTSLVVASAALAGIMIAFAPNEPLEYGSTEPDVAILQGLLHDNIGRTPDGKTYFSGQTSEHFGSRTEKAVRSWEQGNAKLGVEGVTPDGKIDENEMEILSHQRKEPLGRADLPDKCAELENGLCVDKSSNTAYIAQGGIVVKELKVGLGEEHFLPIGWLLGEAPTEAGDFKVTWKDPNHVSRLTGGKMDASVFFNEGAAMHVSEVLESSRFLGRLSESATRSLFYSGSKGCVTTGDREIAAAYYQFAKPGQEVIIAEGKPLHQNLPGMFFDVLTTLFLLSRPISLQRRFGIFQRFGGAAKDGYVAIRDKVTQRKLD